MMYAYYLNYIHIKYNFLFLTFDFVVICNLDIFFKGFMSITVTCVNGY